MRTFGFSACIVVAAAEPRDLLSRRAPIYETDFTSFDSDNWKIDTGCTHCSSKKRDECTRMSEDAGVFGKGGLTLTTTHLSKKDKCGAGCQSFHMEFQQTMQYGSYKASARWFPESHASSAVGYLGLLQAEGKGSASITFGFRGKADGLEYDGTSKFKTGCYADSKLNHNLVYVDAQGARMDEWHDYELRWYPKSVTWLMDGREMRKVTDTSIIPSCPMTLRIHSRSVDCGGMSNDFNAHITNFSYTPYTPSPQPTPSPTPPPPVPTPSPSPPGVSDTLASTESLHGGETLISAGGKARLMMQQDGNLVLHDDGASVILWSSGTQGHTGSNAHLKMQSNTNLVIKSNDGDLWKSGQHSGAVKAVLQDDCDLSVLSDSGATLWSLGTKCASFAMV